MIIYAAAAGHIYTLQTVTVDEDDFGYFFTGTESYCRCPKA